MRVCLQGCAVALDDSLSLNYKTLWCKMYLSLLGPVATRWSSPNHEDLSICFLVGAGSSQESTGILFLRA